jgi:hypothetical protein
MGLYKSTDQVGQPLNTAYAEDSGQFVDLLSGIRDGGTLSLLAPIAAPAAPAVTKSAGSVTGTGYQWGVYWITGVMDGTGAAHITGRTIAGTLSASTSLTAQQATISIAAFGAPTGAIGWGVVRNKSGGATWFQVPNSEQFLSIAGTMPSSFIDNTADASLVTAAPSTNSTGTSLSGAIAGPMASTVAALNAKFPSSAPPHGAVGAIENPTGVVIPLRYDANAAHWYSLPIGFGSDVNNGEGGAAVTDYRPCRDGGLGLQLRGVAQGIGTTSASSATSIAAKAYFFNGTSFASSTFLTHSTTSVSANFNDDWTTIVSAGSASTYDAIGWGVILSNPGPGFVVSDMIAYAVRYYG